MKKIVFAVTILMNVMNLNACKAVSNIPEPSITVSEEELQMKAFGKVLWDAYQKGVLPDGHQLDYTNMESAEENSFAIIDIDNDGKDELLLYWVNACMAGMTVYVFGYANGDIYVELSEWPSLTFYDNGTVKAEWSHNQGLAGDFWPYNVYCYDAENDVYQSCGSVDAWDRSRHEESYEGEIFPSEIDVDGDGLIYYILPADWDGHYDVPLVDGADYENWQKSYFEGAEEITISTQRLTEENIAVLGYPKPYVPVSEPLG